jgi:A/G-specific adenine glycosylase
MSAEPLQASDRTRSLIHWSTTGGRRMPWRSSADPYALAVAEVLLQKTRADAAKPVWSELLARFPSPASLATANDAEVSRIVGHLGLGAQRSARLKAMARALHDGSDQVPGIGPYGAGVLALSRRQLPTEVPVDGNVARIVARVDGLTFEHGEARKKAAVKDGVRALLDSAGGPGAQLRVLYALVDLGANVCTPRNPGCDACPLARSCRFAEASRAS